MLTKERVSWPKLTMYRRNGDFDLLERENGDIDHLEREILATLTI